jgi:FkbM family methyltransferase
MQEGRPNIVAQSIFGPIIVNSNDEFIAKSILQTGAWALPEISIIGRMIEVMLTRKNKVVFYDIGANFGAYTLALARKFDDKITIKAFEAQRLLYYMLCGTMALNNLDNVECFRCAVSDTSGEKIDFETPDYFALNNFGAVEILPPMYDSDAPSLVKSGKIDSVLTVRIDDFREEIDFLKIDIEGMELKAILGGAQCIERHRPVCIVEFTKTNKDAVAAFFHQRNYRAYLMGGDLVCVPDDREFGLSLERVL